ncbi:MAG: condensation domain-containing protein, partial [Acidobacteriota bacterium]|nr:condensation domain-containing protein [Acidobacteriota bacterium]
MSSVPGRKAASEEERSDRLARVLEKAAARQITLARTPRSARETSGDRLVIERVPRDRPLPLAVAQERFWFLHQLDPDSPADNIAVALRLEGPFRADLYQRTWDQILARHEILRTHFPVEAGQPVQVVDRPEPAFIRHVDLSEQPAEGREAGAIAAATEEADRPFDLVAGKLLRLVVYRLDDETHLVLGVFHHIVCDLWSLGVISHELVEIYSALAENRAVALPELPFQYADYAVCHRTWVDSPAVASQVEYWRQQLSGLKDAELRTDRPRQLTRGTGATGVVDLPRDLLASIKELAGQEGATPFMALIGAFTLLLRRYTGETDIAVGTPIANRTRLALKALVGTFVNTLVFRTDLSSAQTFRDLLAQTRKVALGAFANQDVSFHRLVNELAVDRRSGRSPLFQVLFNVQNAPVRLPQFPGLRMSHVTLPRQAAQFDLTVWVDTDVLHQVGYAYDSSLFDRTTIERLMAHYVSLLRAVVEEPDARLSDMDVLSSSERDTLVHDFNRTDAPLSGDTVADLFARQARRTPNAPALEAAGQVLSYEELDARATAVASALRARGAGVGSLVGVCLHRSASLVATMLGILRCGAAYLPLDPSFPRDRIAYMLRDSEAALVVTEPDLAGLVTPDVDLVFATALERGSSTAETPLGHSEPPSADDLAYVIYTSGSTGRPKGVEITHRALANLLQSMATRPGLQATDRLLAVTTVSFDISGLEIFLPLIAGATVIMASRDDAGD